jgi:hypothetical protein
MLVALLALTVVSVGGWKAYKANTAGDMAGAAEKFLATLDEKQRAQTLLDFDTPKRLAWHFIPLAERKGLQVREMNDEQRAAAHKLLKASLSEVGYGKATKIMELENLLKELEKNKTGTPLRDPVRYYFTIFGKPTPEGKWGLSVEGHHLSLNFVVDKNEVISSTPAAMCTNPAIVKQGAVGIETGTRVLEKEETLAFELVNSLSDEQKQVAIIATKAPSEVRAAGEKQPPQEKPAGIAAAKLNNDQKKLLRQLVEVYLKNHPEDVVARHLDGLEQAGWDNLHFAWAGALEPGVGHYYRIQGPTFLVEFINVQPDAAGNRANHIHSLWRDMRGDFAVSLK